MIKPSFMSFEVIAWTKWLDITILSPQGLQDTLDVTSDVFKFHIIFKYFTDVRDPIMLHMIDFQLEGL